jgi:hypothetical protein
VADSTSRSQAPRTRAQIEADIAASRERLASSIEDLIDQVHPQRVKARQIESAKRLAHAELDNARAQVFYPNGELRTSRLAAVGGAVAGFVTFVIVVRRIVRGGKAKRRNS